MTSSPLKSSGGNIRAVRKWAFDDLMIWWLDMIIWYIYTANLILWQCYGMLADSWIIPALAAQTHFEGFWHSLPIRWIFHVRHWVSLFKITMITIMMLMMSNTTLIMTRYAPLGDLTSNITEAGLGEPHTKRVAKQVMIIQLIREISWFYHDNMVQWSYMMIRGAQHA